MTKTELTTQLMDLAVLTFWISVGIAALNGESEFMDMPIGRLALIGVAATIAAVILGVAAVTLMDNTTEDNADTE